VRRSADRVHAHRDEAVLALPPRLLQAAMAPTEPFPMKVIPPFATPPRAPHWRF